MEAGVRNRRTWQRLTSTQWAIAAGALDEILSLSQHQHLSPEALAAQTGRHLENSYEAQVRNGVAILPVKGPLFRYDNFMAWILGASTYQVLALDLQRVVEDDSVHAILLDVDSPGGETNGMIELAEMIYAARSRKPVWAYVGGSGTSAAYALAAAATRVVAAETAQLGSVGVVAGITDRSGQDEKFGVKRYEIVSSQSPHKRVDPGSKDGRAQIQGLVDATADVLIDRIAMFRGVGRDTVIGDFGQGFMMLGQAAVEAGMADAVGSFEAVLAELATVQDRTNNTVLGSGAGGVKSEGDMTDKTKSDKATGLTDEELLAKGKAEGEEEDEKAKGKAAEEEEEEEDPKAKGKGKSKAKGKAAEGDEEEEDEDEAKATSERSRIKTILGHAEAKGRTDLANHLAFDTDMTVEAAAVLLAKSPRAAEQGAPEFLTAMQGAGNPDVGAGTEGGGGGDDTSAAVQSIVAAAKAAGDARY